MPVVLPGVWNPGTEVADYSWTQSTEATLLGYEVRISPGPVYDADASSVIATIPGGGLLTFSSDAGLTVPGTTIAVKVFVILTTGNERGSNTLAITRPV